MGTFNTFFSNEKSNSLLSATSKTGNSFEDVNQTQISNETEYIIEGVLNYVRASSTNYAVMLNGNWGSGKTYFWKHILRSRIEAITNENEEKMRTVYISLYGVKSIEEINKQLFLEVYILKYKKIKEIAESKAGGRLTQTAKSLITVAKSFEFPVLDKLLDANFTIDFENLTDFKNIVLCFDDLERASLEITDILGYLNNFVEHDNVKVLIISNEKEVSDRLNSRNYELKMITAILASDILSKPNANKKHPNDDSPDTTSVRQEIEDNLRSIFNKSDDYKRIKEKLIGKTLTYSPNHEAMIKHIIDHIKDKELNGFLNENLDVLVSTFKNSNTHNIRVLKHAIVDYSLVFQETSKKFSEIDKTILLDMLIFTLAVSFEIKTGGEGSEELENIDSNEELQTKLMSSLLFNEEKPLFVNFYKKYYDDTNKYMYFKFIEILVRNGVFNRVIFEKELSTVASSYANKKKPLHLRFLQEGYWTLSEDEFEEVVPETYNKFKQGEIHLAFYFNGFRIFKLLSKKRLFNINVSRIKEDFLNGLDLVLQKQEYYEHLDTTFLGENLNEDLDTMLVVEKIEKINKKLYEKLIYKELHRLFQLVPDNLDQFYIKLRNQYSDTPIFLESEIELISQKLISLSNPDIIKFANAMKDRYSFYRTRLKNDLEPLRLLQNKLNNYVASNQLTLRISLLEQLSLTIGKICNDFETRDVTN
ncbi:P-loop NTPase fold protein [Paenibacillus chitinolyticus]|uniref:P-loop NTPase fold protein n=1 Tax=Paenibacillus chitinolyticus TaxID=79263 RepID=UPI0036DF70FB